MVKTVYITGHKSSRLNIYKDDTPEVYYLKQFIAHKLRHLLDEGSEWVLIQGQVGIELWSAEVVIELEKDSPDIEPGTIMPFLGHIRQWSDKNQTRYTNIIQQTSFTESIHHTEYMEAYQFKQADQFMLDHTGYTILIYGDEQKTSPKYFKTMLIGFMEKASYTCDIVTFDELADFINDLQRSQDRNFE